VKQVDHGPTFEDAFNLLAGDFIGSGIHRKVFACTLRPELVVKVEYDEPRSFANVHEMRFWNDNEDRKAVADWLAPCEFLSPDGRLLLQYRVDPLPSDYVVPKYLPYFLGDLKRANFGLYQGRFVCVDYSMTPHNPNIRMTKAPW
jgi:hypothetical protein